MSITFYLTLIISREYGSKGYGLFSIVQSFPAIFYLIADFGLNAIATREISRDSNKSQEILGNVLFLRSVISLVAIASCIIFSQFLYPDEETKYGILIGSLIIVSQTFITTANIIFQIKLKYLYSSFANTVGYIFILVSTLILVHFKISVIYLNLMYIIGSFISLAISIFLLKILLHKFKLSYQKAVSKHLVLESLPLGIMFIFSQVNMRADSILLSLLKIPNPVSNLQAVGIYALPYKFFEVILVIPTFLMNSIYPVLLESYNKTKSNFQETFRKVVVSMGFLGLIASITLSLLIYFLVTPEMIINLFGADFVDSKVILLILSSGLLFFFLTQPLSWYLVIKNQQKLLPIIYFTASIFNVGANFILIPVYGYFASATITIVSEFLIFILLAYFSYAKGK
jgi:O-antigen/teichoic acid export membrane protein